MEQTVDDAFQRNWLIGLTAVVALLFAWIGLSASVDALDRALALAGSLLIVAALATARRARRAGGVLLVLGTLPLAVATWWSIVTPLLAVLALVLGGLATRRTVPRVPIAKTGGD
jgi:hypothetical protein